MTYGRFKASLRALLRGDSEIPPDAEEMSSLVEMAYIELAGQATALKLLTADHASQVIRQGPGGTYIRMPDIPVDDIDELDIDQELTPALARLIASYLSREKGGIHYNEAQRSIKAYESKVRVFLLEQDSEGKYDSVGNEGYNYGMDVSPVNDTGGVVF